ncbi:hypothetical protein Tco_1402808 [Tanacetum coccineum]
MLNTNNNLQTQTSNALHNAIMEAGGKDRPPMLAPSNYVQWKSRIKRYINTKPNNELIHYCLQNPPYKFKWTEKIVPVTEGSSETTTKGYVENYKNVSQDIRNQLDVEAIAFGKFTSRDGESLKSYYSRFYKMMNELVRNQCDVTNHQVDVHFLLQLQPEWQMFVMLVKQIQELKTVSYHKLYDILKQHQNEVNEVRAERLARTANPLVLVAQKQPVYHPQNHPNHYTRNSSTRSQQAATRNKGKAIVNSPPPTYDQEPDMVTEDDALLKEKEIDKLMALISLSFKKIYKPTNNNLRTSSNTSRAHLDNTPRINRGTCNGMSETETGKGRSLSQGEDAIIQEVTPDDADNSGPIFDTKLLQKVQNDDDNYNVFANDREHPEQPESVNDTYLEEQGDTNITTDSLDMSNNGETVDQDDDDNLARECDLLASLIDKLKCDIDDSKNHLKKFQAELDRYHDVNYASRVEIDCAKAKGDLLEYYYADHMNAILGVYTTLDEFTDLKCDYVDQVVKYERLEKEISKRTDNVTNKSFNELSKRFSEVEQHSINLELALQQNLKAQLQDKDIAISELKKLIEKIKGKYVEAKFEKPSVIRQPNAFKSQRQSVLGLISTTSISRPQLKSNQLEDRVMHNNSEGKKHQVEDHRKNFKFANNKTSHQEDVVGLIKPPHGVALGLSMAAPPHSMGRLGFGHGSLNTSWSALGFWFVVLPPIRGTEGPKRAVWFMAAHQGAFGSGF